MCKYPEGKGFPGRAVSGKTHIMSSRHVTQNIYSILQVPTTQLAKMSIDPKFVELTADVLEIFFIKHKQRNIQSPLLSREQPQIHGNTTFRLQTAKKNTLG